MDALPDRSNDEARARHPRQRIQLWPTARPIPYENNPRNCPPEAIAKVANSIRQFGFMQPIVVDPDGVVVVGNTRLLAAKKLGLAKVPVLVYEPFCGSGTAIIAAELTGRRCRALELSPAYCDVAVRRWEAFTGRKASCDGPGH
jgi:hypothetical protein